MRFLLRLALVAVLTINLSSCSPVFKQGLVTDSGLQEASVRHIAKNSTGIIDYVAKIYNIKPLESFGDHVVTEAPISENLDYRFKATDFFRIYCNEKDGNLYQWRLDISPPSLDAITRDAGRYIIVCENAKKIDSVLLYEAYQSNSLNKTYTTVVTFATKDYLDGFLNKNHLYGFESSNGMVMFPSTGIYDPAEKFRKDSDAYFINFNYENKTKNTVDMSLFNSYAIINGTKYELGPKKGWIERKDIDPGFFSKIKASIGVFNGQEDNRSGMLRLLPGQKITGELKFSIQGRTAITESDMNSFILVIDGIKYENFKKIDYFTKNKKPL